MSRVNVSCVDNIQEEYAGVVLLGGICLCSPLLHGRFRGGQSTHPEPMLFAISVRSMLTVLKVCTVFYLRH